MIAKSLGESIAAAKARALSITDDPSPTAAAAAETEERSPVESSRVVARRGSDANKRTRLSSMSKQNNGAIQFHSKSVERELESSFGSPEPAPKSVSADTVSAEIEYAVTDQPKSLRRPMSVPVNMSGLNRSTNDLQSLDAQTSERISLSELVASQNGYLKTHNRSKSYTEDGLVSQEGNRQSQRHHHIHSLSADTAAKSVIHLEGDAEVRPPTPPPEPIEDRSILEAEITKKVISSARSLLLAGKISESEFESLLNCDAKFRDAVVRDESEESTSRLEECFGEPWANRRIRLLTHYFATNKIPMNKKLLYPHEGDGEWPEYDLRCFIVKSNDDLRQEVCCLQLIELCQEIFTDIAEPGTQCKLFLKTYRIISTNSSSGIVQVIPDTMSLDALKKTPGFTTLPEHFQKVYGLSSERLHAAQRNFVASLAAYSVVCYIFQIKDRHNGNILIDRDGHLIHIDFGFLLGIAPGGSFSIESAPFKLTEEMVDVFGGLDSPFFSEFLRAFTSAFLALRANAETIISTISLMATQSTFPCFIGKDTNVIIDRLRGRFRSDLSVGDTVQHCLDLIIQSYAHYGTKQYDTFQWLTNGIMP